MTTKSRHVPVRFRIITALAILAALIGITAQRTSSSAAASGQGSAIAAQAAIGCPKATGGDSQVPCIPSRFTDTEAGDLATHVTAAQARADQVAAKWLAAHPTRNDEAFLAFALTQVGTPPAGAEQDAELASLHKIADNRTPIGLKTSAWLEVHGKKDIWTLLRTEFRLRATKKHGKTVKTQADLAYTLANSIAGTAKAKVKRPSPYVVDPTLAGQNQAKFAGKVRYSFPSKHAVIAAAEVAVLTAANPADHAEYQGIQAQIDYSRLYAGGHYASDIVQGAFLGRLAGDYAASIA